ncbi:MAG: 30S ribosomal protein S9 [Planctomycetota bacterium]
MSELDAPTATLDAPSLDAAPEEQVQTRPLAEPAKPDAGGFVWGTGRRKSAVARVRVRPAKEDGKGVFLISGPKAKDREVDAYFSEPQHQAACRKPLEVTGMTGKLDIYVNAQGGGFTGQAEAVLLGVARALKGYDPTLEQVLRDEGLMTRDPREVERKKYGQRGARRRFQFSKR